MTIRGILFDAAGVFYRRPGSTRKYVASLVEGMGLSMDLSAEDRLRQKALRSQANRGHLSPNEYWDQVLLMVGVADPVKMRWLEQVGVAEFVDVVACSTVVGAHKPDPVIYLDALQQAQLTPDEVAFVGHDTDELDGAHRTGMATVAVNYEPGAKADYYVRSLVELLNVPIFGTAHT
jgi:beta-phosphoglucomutase-like phosphatase (HAD superfamily)